MSDSQRWLMLVGTVAAGFLIYLLVPVLTPFLAAFILAYFFTPVVDRLESWHLSRVVAVIIVLLLIILLGFFLAFLLVPLLEEQINFFLHNLPVINHWMMTIAWPWLMQHFNVNATINFDQMKTLLLSHLPEGGQLIAKVVATITNSTAEIVAVVANVILIPVLVFYFLCDWKMLTEGVVRFLPRQSGPAIVQMMRDCGDVLAAFFRGQLLVMICLGIIYGVGLWITGLSVGLLIGLFAGALSIVPYLGFIVGLLLAVVFSLIQFHTVLHLLAVLVVFGIGEAAESLILIPWLVGDRTGVHPLLVIFAVMVGEQLFGFAGILLAVPVAAVMMVMVKSWYRMRTV